MLFTRRSFLQQLVATASMAWSGSRALGGSEKGKLATNGSPLTEGAAHQIAIADVEEMPQYTATPSKCGTGNRWPKITTHWFLT